MEINRNNYEEFFLLYADNELSAAEKQLVELFTRENPDLKQELELLQQSKLVADNHIVFENKETLMRSSRNANAIINHSNYEEFFLLYLDNELSEDDKIGVEKFADKYPLLWHEMMLLEKAHIEPDESIVYPDKEKLYRRERKKIMLLPWQRIAAAAAVLLLAGLFVFRNTNQKINRATVATADKNTRSATTETKKIDVPVTSASHDALHIQSTVKEEKQLAVDIKSKSIKKSTTNKKDIVTPVSPGQKEPAEDGKDILPVVVENKNIPDDHPANTDKITIPTDAVATLTNIKTQELTNKQMPNPPVQQTSYTDQADRSGEEPNSFLAFSTKKSKMRGIFRRVTRVFEKTTNVEGEKSSVLIGNFQIAVK